MVDRDARYGLNLHRVYVSGESNVASLWVNVEADVVIVTPTGALILAVEVGKPIDNLEETPDCDLRRKDGVTDIDMPTVAVFALGHWHAAIMIDHETHSPSFLGMISPL